MVHPKEWVIEHVVARIFSLHIWQEDGISNKKAALCGLTNGWLRVGKGSHAGGRLCLELCPFLFENRLMADKAYDSFAATILAFEIHTALFLINPNSKFCCSWHLFAARNTTREKRPCLKLQERRRDRRRETSNANILLMPVRRRSKEGVAEVKANGTPWMMDPCPS